MKLCKCVGNAQRYASRAVVTRCAPGVVLFASSFFSNGFERVTFFFVSFLLLLLLLLFLLCWKQKFSKKKNINFFLSTLSFERTQAQTDTVIKRTAIITMKIKRIATKVIIKNINIHKICSPSSLAQGDSMEWAGWKDGGIPQEMVSVQRGDRLEQLLLVDQLLSEDQLLQRDQLLP